MARSGYLISIGEIDLRTGRCFVDYNRFKLRSPQDLVMDLAYGCLRSMSDERCRKWHSVFGVHSVSL